MNLFFKYRKQIENFLHVPIFYYLSVLLSFKQMKKAAMKLFGFMKYIIKEKC